jgi:hypothetical protein
MGRKTNAEKEKSMITEMDRLKEEESRKEIER